MSYASGIVRGRYLFADIPVTRAEYDDLIADKLEEAIQAARDTLDKAGLTAHTT